MCIRLRNWDKSKIYLAIAQFCAKYTKTLQFNLHVIQVSTHIKEKKQN